MDTAIALVKARELIEDPERWTQGEYARNREDGRVDGDCPAAVCWCAIGAMHATVGLAPSVTDDKFEPYEFLGRAATELFDRNTAEVNDELGHDAVLRLYDRALELAAV